jgi:hypothetical protein
VDTPSVASTVATVASTSWEFWPMLAFACVGGGFGGCADLLARIQLKDGRLLVGEEKVPGWRCFGLMLLTQVIIGVCGAGAVLFIFCSTTWFKTDDTAQTRLWLLSLSVVAGYGARRFLPMVTRKMERQIEELQQKVQRDHQEIKKNEERSVARDIIARGLALLGPVATPTPTEMNASLVELRQLIRTSPTERAAVIVAGRILRRLDDCMEAVIVHTDFIEAKLKAREKDVDYADVLYNRACYQNLMWAREPGHDSLKEKCLQDLEESVRYNPQNARAAKEDSDFSPIAADPTFKRITAIQLQ